MQCPVAAQAYADEAALEQGGSNLTRDPMAGAKALQERAQHEYDEYAEHEKKRQRQD